MRGQVLLVLLLLIPFPIVAQDSERSDMALHGLETETGYSVIVKTTIKEADGILTNQIHLTQVDKQGNFLGSVKIHETGAQISNYDLYEYSNGDLLLLLVERDTNRTDYIRNNRLIRMTSEGEILFNTLSEAPFPSFAKFLIPEIDKPQVASIEFGNIQVQSVDEDGNFDTKIELELGDMLFGDIIFLDGFYYIFGELSTSEETAITKAAYNVTNGAKIGSTTLNDFDVRTTSATAMEDGFILVTENTERNVTRIYRDPVFTNGSDFIELPDDEVIWSPTSVIETPIGMILWGYAMILVEHFFVFIHEDAQVEPSVTLGNHTLGEVKKNTIENMIKTHDGGLALGLYRLARSKYDEAYLVKFSSDGKIEWESHFNILIQTTERHKIFFHFSVTFVALLTLIGKRKKKFV